MAGVFRKTALERLSSPDQLDSMLKITSPMSWVGIGAAGALAAAVVAWAFMGSIPNTVAAPGVLVYSYNTNTLFSPAYGTVKEIFVEAGEIVEPETPVMEICTPMGEVLTITSDQRGIISGCLVSYKQSVTPNAELFRLSPVTENDLSLVCYVDQNTAKQLENGMEASVYLSAVDPDTYGHMKAEITNIDRYVSSESAMAELLGADGHLTEMLTQDGPVAAVTCELQADDTTESGYYFSSARGTGVVLVGGELATVQIVTDENEPISLVFPMFGGN